MTDKLTYDSYEALVEYEWAVINRLGLEVEVPFQLNFPIGTVNSDSIPSSRMESLKLAIQWSFFVNEKLKTSMTLGYINEFEFTEFRRFGKPLIFGNIYNPFFIGAKRWGSNLHTLIYTGPQISQTFKTNEFKLRYKMHSNFHYMIPGTRNFIGIEVNKYFDKEGSEITLRPQMRVAIADNFMIGIVPSIPIDRSDERLGMFLRVIWEPRDPHN